MMLTWTPLLILLAVAACADLRWRWIPNLVPLALAGLYLLGLVAGTTRAASLATAALVLAAGFGAWRVGWLGAGDAKLTAAVALFASPAEMPALILVTALAGGLVALPILWFRQGGWAWLLPLAVGGGGRE